MKRVSPNFNRREEGHAHTTLEEDCEACRGRHDQDPWKSKDYVPDYRAEDGAQWQEDHVERSRERKWDSLYRSSHYPDPQDLISWPAVARNDMKFATPRSPR